MLRGAGRMKIALAKDITQEQVDYDGELSSEKERCRLGEPMESEKVWSRKDKDNTKKYFYIMC